MNLYDKIYREAAGELAAGRKVTILTTLDSRCPLSPTKSLFKEADFASQEAAAGPERELARTAWESGQLRYAQDQAGSFCIAEPYFPEARLIILGGGHIAKPLAEFGAKCGFAVTVADDRPAFANRQRFPLASHVFCESFERCFPLLDVNPSAFVVIVTRGHRHDMDCLRQTLKLDAAYTGMIGSRRRVQAIMRQLAAEGYPEDKLAAVRSPIGLAIGAVTPEEIAVSILAEVIQHKRKTMNARWPQLEREVLEDMLREQEEPGALITIIETRGSAPREAGAKMLLRAGGKTTGSIGGGCGESQVIGLARDVIRDGGCRIAELDLTGEIAENDGMVCGGTMKVVIERYC
jgi:xanthine dehydrogenase accessory factor